MWRIIRILLGIYLIGNLIGAYFYWHRIDQFLRFMPRVPAASFAAPVNELEAQKQDLAYLKTVLDYDRSFSQSARLEFETKIEKLTARETLLSKAEFYMSTRELMALADNAHTNVTERPAFKDFNRSGIDVYPFADGLYVVRAHKNHADLIGLKVVAIEGMAIHEVMTALEKYSGGVKQWRDLRSLNFLRSPELLHVAGIAANPNRLNVTTESASGKTRDVSLLALDSVDSDYYRHAYLTLTPRQLPDEKGEWVQSLDQNSDIISPYLTDIFDVYKTAEIGSGLYIRSNSLMPSPENPVKEQLLSAIGAVPHEGYKFIALDLRWNPGGDYGSAVAFAKQAARATSNDGKIYVDVGPNTFSAAIVFTALLKQYAPDKTFLIGEPMGDRPQFWAERGKPFVLPNSGYWINYSTGYHDWENGCADTHKFCFPPNKRYDAKIGLLALDAVVEPTYRDYTSGRDLVMERIMQEQTEAR